MKKLIQQIETIRAKLDGWRRLSMNEAQTRATIVDPLLESLGWEVRDPAEVQLEYPTVDGKAVDYGLKIVNEAVLLVEAKPLGDPLNDVKAITQVVGYAANDGIAWCILTNGVKWRVYRSMEKCQAPDKLMFEVSLDPRESEGLSNQQLAEQMWRFSREEMAKGTLDKLGEETFNDSKARKALDHIMRNPPRSLVKIMRQMLDDEALTSQKIKESLGRIWANFGWEPHYRVSADIKASNRRPAPRVERAREPERKARKKGAARDESLHTDGKPKEVIELYRAIDRYCFSLDPDTVEKRYLRRYINYIFGKEIFCSVILWHNKIGVYLKLKYDRLSDPPDFGRDVTGLGHWGVGDLELSISSLSQLDRTKELIRQTFESIA